MTVFELFRQLLILKITLALMEYMKMPKIAFDYDDKHEYLKFIDKEISNIFHDLREPQPLPIILKDKTKDILTNSSELEKLDTEYLARYRRQIVFQYLISKNKSLLPLYYVYDFLVSEFKNEEILSFAKKNNSIWIEFLHEVSKYYAENSILQKFENKIEFLGEQKIVDTISNKYMKPFSLKLKNGLVWFGQGTELSIARKLNSLISRFGGLDFLYNIFCNLNRFYNNAHHRYIFNVGSQKITESPISEIPWNYLILLGFRNVYTKPVLDNAKKEEIFTEIIETAKSFISLYELEQFSHVSRVISRMKFSENEMYKQVLFSFLYRFQQCDKLFFAKICLTLFEFPEAVNSEFEKSVGFSIPEYINLIQKVITYAPDYNIYPINKAIFEQRELDLIDTLSHKEEICKNYFIPTDFDKMENSVVMKPFVKIKQDYFFIDCSYSCWNFYNVIFLLLNENAKLKEAVSERIGKNIEKILVDECCAKNLKIHYGHYNGSDFECDLVIETKKSVIFIE